MTGSNTPVSLHTRFSEAKARLIGDQAMLFLSSDVPGCQARRFDIPNPPFNYWPIEPCFAEQGPIAPILSLSYIAGNSLAVLSLTYQMMFRDCLDVLRSVAFGPKIPATNPLSAGPEAIAATARQAMVKWNFDGMIAAAAPERFLAERPRPPVPLPNLYLGQCAVFLGKDDEARGLLENTIKYAEEDLYQSFGEEILEAKTILSKLDQDADAYRKELTDRAAYNWSHFKVISH